MFPIVLSISLVNLINFTVVGSLVYYVYKKNLVSYDCYDILTFLKPRYHLLPVNVEKYKEDRLEYIQTMIKEYNDLYGTSLLLVEEDSDEDDDEVDDVNDEKVVVETKDEVIEDKSQLEHIVVLEDKSDTEFVKEDDDKIED